MEPKSSLILCSATSRRLFFRPAKSKRHLTNPSPTSWSCSKSGHREGRSRWSTLWLDIARYQPLRGGSYISLPAAVQHKKAVINVKKKGDHCLRWALRSALFTANDHADRSGKYPTEDGLDFYGIDAPTPISQIPKVEKQNNLAINVFGWDKGMNVHTQHSAGGHAPH